jgi:hypothetical protein
MARNRRKVEGEVTVSWIFTRLLLFFLMVGFLLGILFLKRNNLKLGEEARLLDQEVKRAQQRTSLLEATLAQCRTPRELENKIARWRLPMVRPQEEQILRFRDPEGIDEQLTKPREFVQVDSIRRR